MTPRAPLVAALATALLIAGCFGAKPRTCTPSIAEAGADAFCFITADGWAIQGLTLAGGNATGPLFVLVHGLNEDHASFATLASDLKALGAGVVEFDLRGHGKSTESKDGPATWQQFATGDFVAMGGDLDGVVARANARLGDHPLVLVGASIGSSFALRHAAANPATDRAVVMLSPGTSYHDVNVAGANLQSKARALFVASEDDQYSAQSAKDLARASKAPVHDLKIWLGGAHGTQMLKIPEERAYAVGWIRAHALA